jgi:thiol-disulfide isomerase/thioredoxin
MVNDDNVMMDKSSEVMEQKESDVMVKDDNVMMDKSSDTMVKEDTLMMSKSYSGNVIAGTTSQYLEFNQEDYNIALEQEKVIVLNFYASWCPSCKEENIQAIEGFNNLNLNNVVGFRVNYKDSNTDSSETELAKKFGISYQHTKVILVNEEQVLKNTESWNSDKYISELSKYSMN